MAIRNRVRRETRMIVWGAITCMLCAACLGMLFLHSSSKHYSIGSGFREVSDLDRDGLLLGVTVSRAVDRAISYVHMHALRIASSDAERFPSIDSEIAKVDVEIAESKPLVDHNTGRIFVPAGSEVVEFDRSCEVLARLDLAQFGINRTDWVCTNVAALTEGCLWVGLGEWSGDGTLPRTEALLRWEVGSPPTEAEVMTVGGRYSELAVDARTDTAYLAGDDLAIVKRGNYRVERIHSVDGWISVDFDARYGVLLGPRPNPGNSSHICVYDPASAEMTRIVRGIVARWAPAGDILYTKTSVQLWRYSQETRTTQPIITLLNRPHGMFDAVLHNPSALLTVQQHARSTALFGPGYSDHNGVWHSFFLLDLQKQQVVVLEHDSRRPQVIW